MKTLPLALVCFSAFAGCLAGSWLALRPALAAHAQTVVVGPNPRQGTSVTVEDSLTIPDGGLRLTDMRRNTVGYFAVTENGLSLIMLNRQGQPGVRLEAGGAGQVILGSSAQETGLVLQNSSGSRARLALSGTRSAAFSLQRQERTLSAEIGEDTRLVIPGRTRAPIAEISSTRDGGSVKLLTAGGKEAARLSSSGNTGSLLLADGAGETKLTGSGKGELVISDGETIKWSAVKQAAGTKDDGQSGPPGLPPGGQSGATGGGR